MRAFLFLLLLWPALAGAIESPPERSPRATATLVADVAATAPGETFRAALRLRLAPGWHTYWRHAGDAGAAAELAWQAPPGARVTDLPWPAPERIVYGPLVNYGYHGEVLLPVAVTLPAGLPDGPVRIGLSATWLVCADVCIPEEGRFEIAIPRGAPQGSAAAPLFAAAEAAAPRESPFAASAGRSGARLSLTLAGEGLSAATVREAWFFPDRAGVLDHAAPQPMQLAAGRLTLALAAAPGAEPAALSGLVAITDPGGRRSAFAVAAPVSGPAAGGLSLWRAAGFALLGGLLLNLMPCVFPVLAMKAMALARLSGAARGAVRRDSLAYGAGVLVCFLALGGLLLGLRAAGAASGWGFQFTAPAFVAATAWLMLAVGLNLSGVFAVGLPGVLGARLGGSGGAFGTGVLAVLVASPCTAPFMGAALAAAMAMPPSAALAIFACLGLGLAAPPLLFALAPGLAQLLPRPGAWMERLKQGLAFPMYAAAAWLVSVVAAQGGAEAVLFVLAGGVLLALGLWLLGLAQASGRRLGLAAGAAAAAVLLAAALLPRLEARAVPVSGAEAWSEARVAALREAGRPVFVNFTAAWCLSCQVNERVALRGEAVRSAFERAGVVVLKADWTHGDATIGAALRAHGREGVPLYLFWPAGAAAPVLLPEILTEATVLAAIGAR
jgi:thiol:disulfide interchange protein DsbD